MSVYAGPNPVEDGLFAYMDFANQRCFDITQPSIARDLIDRNYTDTINGPPTFNSNNRGYLAFNGSTDSIHFSDVDYPLLDTDSITIEIVLRIPSAATWSDGTYYGNVLTKGEYSGSIGIARHPTNNTIGMWARGSTSGAGAALMTIQRDVWYHIVGTYNGTTGALYRDGMYTAGGSWSVVGGYETGTSASHWALGERHAMSGTTGNQFQGDVAYAKIYSRVLTSDEILQNYTASRGRYQG